MLIEGTGGIDELTVTESEWPADSYFTPSHINEDSVNMELTEFDDSEGTERLPLISREGFRQHKSRRGGYQQNRIRKSNRQVDYLKRIYKETGGKLDRKQRKRAVKVTGLSWIQIYKWIFDT